ncbi:MAG TPA: acyl carrier protein [Burkholderiales bacterium]|nr:acyl carrier protein [Burkholderiales bacterium]
MSPTTETIKAFILKEFLPGQDPAELTETTPLITSRILDSLATIKLVLFIEERFHVTLQAHETDVDHMNTLRDITNLVESKPKTS